MTTEQRTGFRLPWSSDRHPATGDASPVDPEEPAEEPVGWVTAAEDGQVATEPDPGADVTEAPDPRSMATRGPGAGEPADDAAGPGAARAVASEADVQALGSEDPEEERAGEDRPAWPAEDMGQLGSAHVEPAGAPQPDSVPTSNTAGPETPEMPNPAAAFRPTKFMAELSRAMQAAAQAAREESLGRLAAESKQRIDEIQALGASGTTELRRRADDDVAATREWSKAEIARIREETERRISDRKSRLEGEVERHAADLRRRADLVRERVAAHEAEMAEFIGRLLGEDDPARIAVLAQHMPEPPELDDLEPAPAEAQPLETGATLTAEGAAAAEAEAPAGLDQDPAGGTSWFAIGAAEAAGDSGPAEAGTGVGGVDRTELLVTGLASVAGIAGFKRELSRLTGVQSVGVSAGQAGEFVFAVSHEPGLDLDASIPTIAGFDTQVTGRRTGTLLVTAAQPATDE